MSFDAFVLVLFMLLLFLVPLYVNHLEKIWIRRLFGSDLESSLGRKVHSLHNENRKTVVKIVIFEELCLCAVAVFIPTTLVHGAAILLLVALALYHNYEKGRKCPMCLSLVVDSAEVCPGCGNAIGKRWGAISGVIQGDWLTRTSRYTRYKCS